MGGGMWVEKKQSCCYKISKYPQAHEPGSCRVVCNADLMMRWRDGPHLVRIWGKMEGHPLLPMCVLAVSVWAWYIEGKPPDHADMYKTRKIAVVVYVICHLVMTRWYPGVKTLPLVVRVIENLKLQRADTGADSFQKWKLPHKRPCVVC